MSDIRNRVKELRTVKYSDLVPNPANWRGHPEAQRKAYAGIVESIGFAGAALARELPDGRLMLIDGHMRRETHPDAELPVLVTDLTEDEANTVLATFDPISAMAEADAAALDSLLRTVNSDNADVQAMLAALAESAGLYADGKREPKEVDAAVDKAAELRAKYGVEVGQVWQLGRHRLACIDSTDEAQVKAFIGGVNVGMVFADPPYGVEVVQDAMVGAVFSESVATKGKYAAVIGDETTDTAERAINLYLSVYPKARHVWWGGNYYADKLPPSSCWLVWDKRAGTEIENTFADCELAWTNHTGAARIYRQLWNGMIREGEHEKRLHPTQKPVRLASWCFEQYTDNGEPIVDPFAGSGITVIAGEQCNRTVYAMELSPDYVAVIIQRWVDLTGKTPRLSE